MYKGNYKNGEIEIINEKIVYENKFCEFYNDDCMFPSGKSGNYLRLKMKGDYSVAVLPVTKDGKMVFIKTFRHSARGWGYEVPKGYGSLDDEPLSCAVRELKEETGLTSSNIVYLGLYHESPSTLQNGLHCFVALDCEKSNDTEIEDFEAIDGCVYVETFDELPKMDYNDALSELLVYKYILNKKDDNLKSN